MDGDITDTLQRRHLHADGDVAERRQPVEPHRKQQHQHQTEPEHRHGVEKQRDNGEQGIRPLAGTHARERAEHDAEKQRRQERGAGQQQRRRQPLGQKGPHRTLLAIGIAEIEGDDPLQIGRELHHIGLVEAVFLTQLRQQLFVRRPALPGDHLRRITRRGMHQHEIEGGDHQHHGDKLGHPCGNGQDGGKYAAPLCVECDHAHPSDTVPKVSCTPIAVVITFFSFLSVKFG